MKRFFMIITLLLALAVLSSCTAPESISCGGKTTSAEPIALAEIPTDIAREAQLVSMTEEEIFALATSDFRGTVTAIENYCVDFDGETHYCAVVTFRVDKALRHNLTEGEEIKVYISAPIGTSIQFTDNEIAAHLEVGMEGIFRPLRYAAEDSGVADSILCMNGVSFDKRELADYGFYDGVRFLFLADGGELIYDEAAFPSLHAPETLDDIETYVLANWDWCGTE